MLHLLYLPGVFLHELSHLLVGLVLLAKPTKFSIIPNKANGSAGEVHFRNVRAYNAFPIAFAPIIGGSAGLWYVYAFLFPQETEIMWKFAYVYLMIVFARTASPSWQDVKVGFSYPLGAAIYIAAILFGVDFFGIADFKALIS